MQWSVLQSEMCSQPATSSQEMHCQVELERLYWEQSEQEYHQQLQEYYILRQQHQLKQQRLNQVLYGHAAPQWPGPAAAPAQQQHLSAAPAHYMDVMMAAASPAREPLQPMHHQFNLAFQQQQQQLLGGGGYGVKVAAGGQPMDVGHVQLIGTKRCSDIGVGELATQGAAGFKKRR